jgi:Bacterial PH domain/Short C-terminal domain
MAFPPQLLADGEEVVTEFRPNWTYLGWPLVSSIGAVALTLGVVISFPGAPIAVLYVLLGVLVVALSWLAARSVRRMATTIVVTTARVTRRTGVLSRASLEIRLERINELSFHQSIAGRLLREGEVLIEVGGETGVVVLDHVPRPAVVQSVISAQVSDWHRRARSPSHAGQLAVPDAPSADTPPAGTALGPPGGARGPNAAERLVQLDELRRRGIVSQDEFDAKRAQLLREL